MTSYLTDHNPWSLPGINERLAELHAMSGEQYLTTRMIAEKLNAEFHTNISRNAIIGRTRRIKLPQRPTGAYEIVRKKPEPKKRPYRRGVDAPIPPAIEPRRASTAGLTIYQTTSGDCKWPLGEMFDLPPYIFCGEPAREGLPYCAHHCRKAYHAPRQTWE